MARLLLMQKNKAPKQVELSGERTLIGRASTTDIRIDHPKVSRHHVELRVEGGTTWLIDLASSNGTLVNGRLVKHCTLQHGDTVQIGDCSIRFLTRHTHFELPRELALAD